MEKVIKKSIPIFVVVMAFFAIANEEGSAERSSFGDPFTSLSLTKNIGHDGSERLYSAEINLAKDNQKTIFIGYMANNVDVCEVGKSIKDEIYMVNGVPVEMVVDCYSSSQGNESLAEANTQEGKNYLYEQFYQEDLVLVDFSGGSITFNAKGFIKSWQLSNSRN
ncbi:hypothetical protein [Photobacterium sanguinicancri]|uniref:hypothetical protein n=1 Tax=Photobacterium sanguinicancri TaxID=875932 RepID=UPI0026E1345A|nr:hypothetical protein [Photobacterium sanguinicancri]MDO6498832.1 hypothetical protein [Photobacterium sanguinicancri]